uniref:Uncharacterized protein n=1 Tax=Cacopsylla melanoneura TaxID=428564 RepID=A0A8D9EN11_9HEMI
MIPIDRSMETLSITTSSLIEYFSVIWLTGPTEGRIANINLVPKPLVTLGPPEDMVKATIPYPPGLTGPTEGKVHFNGNLADLPLVTFCPPEAKVNPTIPCPNAANLGPGETTEPWTGRTDRFGKPIITSTLKPFALKKTGALLCKGGMVAHGARVDPECAAQMRSQFEAFAGLTFQEARCEKGHCIVDHIRKNIVVYSCDCEQNENGTVIGYCKILAPITLPTKAKEATWKTFIREELYY